jgi:hypothetical protein
MANTDAPKGAVPIKHLDGSPWNGALNEYLIASAYNTTIYFGDFVKMTATGKIELAAAGDTTNLGSFQGVNYRNSSGEVVFSKYWPASTATFNSEDAKALVVDQPDVIFEMQMDSDGATPSQADIGTNADFVSTHTGSTLTGLSKMEVDTSTCTTATANLRILRFVPKPDNAVGAYAKVEVLINEHFYKTTTGI